MFDPHDPDDLFDPEEDEELEDEEFEDEYEEELYTADIEGLRLQLEDYYGTAAQENPAAYMDLGRIESMTDEEVFDEARNLGLV